MAEAQGLYLVKVRGNDKAMAYMLCDAHTGNPDAWGIPSIEEVVEQLAS